MRLSCPNCEAQYEVPDDVIPMDGRDVQCSNCGQSWFVTRTPATVTPAETDEISPRKVSQKKRATYPPQERDIEDDIPADLTPPPVAKEVKQVLRQEAEREMQARRADSNPDFEVQEDLGLETPAGEAEVYAETDPSNRRALLPDIEEINSTLAATPMPKRHVKRDPKEYENIANRRKLGFRLGFVLALVILGILTALYVFAPWITENFPSLADHVNTYVFWINDARQWLFETTDGFLSDFKEAGTTPAN